MQCSRGTALLWNEMKHGSFGVTCLWSWVRILVEMVPKYVTQMVLSQRKTLEHEG
ncbi:unnamed protein product [Musa hybrid cultivar]